MRQPSTDRRSVLARVAELTMAGAIAGAAGCLSEADRPAAAGDGTSQGDDTATGTLDSTPATGFEYADWLPAPAALGGDSVRFGVVRPAVLAGDAVALGQDYYDELVAVRGLLELTGIAPEDVDTHVAITSGSAIEVAFDAGAVTTALEDGGYESAGTREGFDVFEPTEAAERTDRVVAVGDGVLVVGRERQDIVARDAAAAIIDAGVEAGERLVDAEPGAATITGLFAGTDLAVGISREPPEKTNVERGEFAGNTAFGYALSVAGDTSTLEIHHVFASADDADADAVKEWVDSAGSGGVFGRMDDVTVTADGATVTTAGTLPTDGISDTALGGPFASTGSETNRGVQAGASVVFDDDSDTVKVTWTSNQNAEHLVVTFEPTGGDPVERRIDEVGGSVTYEGTDGASVRVKIVGHAGDQSTVIMDKTVDL